MLVVNKRPHNGMIGVERIPGALILSVHGGKIKLEPRSADVIRVVYSLEDTFSAEEKPGIILKDVYDDWDYNETDKEISFITSHIRLMIIKETMSFQYYDRDGKLLLK